LLVVDNASTDGTLEIAHGYESDPRVRVIEVDHCNIPTKFARVVTEATSEWIAFLDSDDISLPHRVERGVAAAQLRPEVVAWFGWSWQIRPDGRRFRITRHGPTDEQQFAELRRAHDIPIFDHNASLFRRDVLLAAGNYDPEITIVPDYDMVDRVSALGLMLTIPEPLIEYRVHGANNSMNNFKAQSKQFDYLWQRRAATDRGEPFPTFAEFAARPPQGPRLHRWSYQMRERSRFYWNAMAVHIASGRWDRALLAAVQSVLWHPRSVGHRLWRNYLRPRFGRHRPLSGVAAPSTPGH
jgi:glycosyltransferase involved in cell wall biosynthesis